MWHDGDLVVSLIYQIYQKLPYYVRKRATTCFYWHLMKKSVTDLSLHFAVLEKRCVGKHPWYWSRQNNKTPMLMPSSLQLYSLLCGTLTDVLEQSTPTHFSASACHCICYHRKKTNSNSSSQDVNNGSYWCMLLQTLHSPSPGTSFLLDQDKVCFGT